MNLHSRLWRHVHAAVLGLMAVAAHGQQPLKFASFDVTKLTRDNFQQTLEPLVKREGKLVLYNFAGNFDPVWKIGLIPKFEAKYGIKVSYHNVRRDQANQQLMAAHKAGMASPVDVYFAGGVDSFPALNKAGVIANVRLADVLPNLENVPDVYKSKVFGIDTSGTWPLVHLNQMALAYDSALLPPAQAPQSFEALLAWAEKNPKKFAITSPSKGGSGSGFVYSAALNFVSNPECLKTLQDPRLSVEELEKWARGANCLNPLWSYLGKLLRVSELTNGNADTLNLLNNQQVMMGTTWEDLALTYVRGKQLPPTLRLTLLQKGLVGGGDGLILAANAKSPAAALLFIDMAFGKEFQAWKMEHHASRSPRSDIDPAAMISADTARYTVPPSQAREWSIPTNGAMSQALANLFEDKVLSKL